MAEKIPKSTGLSPNWLSAVNARFDVQDKDIADTRLEMRAGFGQVNARIDTLIVALQEQAVSAGSSAAKQVINSERLAKLEKKDDRFWDVEKVIIAFLVTAALTVLGAALFAGRAKGASPQPAPPITHFAP